MAREHLSWPELVRIMGEDGARDMCNSYGGIPVYVPKRPNDELLFNLGEEAALALCKHYGGSDVTAVLGPTKPDAVKDMAIPLLEAGMSERDVVIALRAKGVVCVIRTVEYAARAMRGGKPKPRVNSKNTGVARLPM